MKYGPLRNALLVATVAGAVLSVAWARRETRIATESRMAEQALQEARARREARSGGIGAVVHPANQAPVEARPASAPLRPSAPPVAGGRDDRAWMTGDPELQNLYLAAERASLPERYAAIWEDLGLSSAQAEKLADLIMQRDEQRLDIAAIVHAKGLGAQDPAVARLRVRTAQAFHAGVAGLLGEAAYQEIAHYERALPVWQFVNQFAGAVALEGQPLTGAQAAQLTATLANASPPYRAGGEADPNAIEWPGVLTESPAILNEPQQLSFSNAVPRYPVEIRR